MSSEPIPEWAMRQAEVSVFAFEGRIQSGEFEGMDPEGSDARDALKSTIARALLAAEQRGLEKAATLIEQGYDRPVATPWSANGASKNDLCPHGMAVYQDCEQCAAAAIRSLGDKT